VARSASNTAPRARGGRPVLSVAEGSGTVSALMAALIVSEKTRLGGGGIDSVTGKNHQGALVALVDRVSKLTLIKKVPSKHADVVAEATITLLRPYLDKALTITAGNGKGFNLKVTSAGHEKIKAALNADVYFAHPYRPWGRGLNENTNGLIRQCFTKGSRFGDITDKDVDEVMGKLNPRPRLYLTIPDGSYTELFTPSRKTLGYIT
jgi:transposase, IS30 family